MILSEWRKAAGLTLRECAERMGLAGKNPARTYQRLETGEQQADADVVEKIDGMTAGQVTSRDMHETRLAFLVRQKSAGQMEAAE